MFANPSLTARGSVLGSLKKGKPVFRLPMPQSPDPAVLLFQRADNALNAQDFAVALQNTPQGYVYGSAIQTTRSADGWTCFNAPPAADTLCSDTQMLDYLNAP